MEIDLNCDLGEGAPFDAELMPFITSANVACGFHAGSPATAFTTLSIAAQHQTQVGAHPGFPDKEHFGRRELNCTEQQIYEDCLYQVGALSAMAMAAGISVRYLKAHGALYNMACRDRCYARPLIKVATLFDLPILGLPDSELQRLSAGHCPFIAEGFADRRYQPNGTLVPRSQPNAFVEDPQEAVQQAQWLIKERQIQTLCVHGDNPKALTFVKTLREALLEHGFQIKPFRTVS